MRELFAYLCSAVLHGGVIGAIWIYVPFAPEYWLTVRSGHSVSTVSLMASMPAESATTLEMDTEAVTEIDATPVELTPDNEKTAKDEPVVDLMEQATNAVSVILPKKPSATKESPPTQETPDSKTPAAKRQAAEKLHASVTSAAIPFQAATELGAQVDELPRKLANNSPPSYPVDALLAKVEGRVVLLVHVQASGVVSGAKIDTSSGSNSLDQAALAAVQFWKFEPAKRAGRAVEYEVLVPVSFSIRGNQR